MTGLSVIIICTQEAYSAIKVYDLVIIDMVA